MERVTRAFRSGDVRVLVSTTVAEEGLDIPECNLIVKYNHVTNEIAMVQRRGRGRALNSHSVLLAQDQWVIDKEKVNDQRELLAQRALEAIQAQPTDQISANLRNRQKDNWQRLNADNNLQDANTAKVLNNGKMFRILCSKCDALICTHVSVCRVDAHYVCADPLIWDRCQPKPFPVHSKENKIFATMKLIGTHCCNQCHQEWGQVIKAKSVYFPQLRPARIKLQQVYSPKGTSMDWAHAQPQKGQPFFANKKWKGLVDLNLDRFVPRPVSPADCAAMKTALSDRIRVLLDEHCDLLDVQVRTLPPK